MRIKRSLWILIILLDLVSGIHSQNNSKGIISFSALLKYNLDSMGGGIVADTNWLATFEDKNEFSKTHCNISNWIHLDTLRTNEISRHPKYKGFAWLRLTIVFDTVPRKPYVLAVHQRGASWVYLNGIKYKDYGTPSLNESTERRTFPNYDPIFLSPKKGDSIAIAVRYSNTNYEQSFSQFGDTYSGVSLSIWPASNYYALTLIGLKGNYSIGLILTIFFLTLSFVHLLLYLFYRKAISNLYYSIFCFMFALIMHALFITNFITTASVVEIESMLTAIVFPFFFFNFLNIIHSIFEFKYDRFFKFLGIASIATIFTLFINGETYLYVLLGLMVLALLRSLILLYRALKEKKNGAKLVASGFGFVAAFFIIFITIIFLNHGLNLSGNSIAGIVVSILLLLSILSIPVSMSIFLAFDFSQTNKTLSKKLIEVEELSAKSIEQEKEKQKILANQNEVLEVQVKERTKEINEQKKVIEEKNKDITDSINYAQRIQRSILPTENEIKDIFKESFVLFKPRDIVSGDFYQFKRNGDLKYAILADCTGHGVPGALMSMVGSNLLKQIILERGTKEPNKILSELHKEVRSTLRQTGGAQSHDGMDAAILLLHKKKIFIASANRPVYIVKQGVLTELKPDKRSIGGSQASDEIEFSLNEIDVEPGMMVYLFSDGYADQFGGEAGKKFKVKNLSDLLLKIHANSLLDQKNILNGTFDDWKKHLEQVDDVSLIGIRF